MNELIDVLLRPGHPVFDDEEAAIAWVVRIRWGRLRCYYCLHPEVTREHVLVRCTMCTERFSIFAGSPLGSLRRPCVRALFAWLHAAATGAGSVSARALARAAGVPHNTLWRHIHRLRALLPSERGVVAATPEPGCVQVCGTTSRQTLPAWVLVVPGGFSAVTTRHHPGPQDLRLRGESVRTWLNGTFHGVRAWKLPLYLREWAARHRHSPPAFLTAILSRIGARVDAPTFEEKMRAAERWLRRTTLHRTSTRALPRA